jgi:gliding motility-associated-like protein
MKIYQFNFIHPLSILFTILMLGNTLFLTSQSNNEILYNEYYNVYRVVAVRNLNDQIISTSNAVSVEKPYALYAPNAFSPDSDGINDFFKISGQGILDFQIEIYNRWGQMVYKSDDLSKGWNGTFKGKNLPTGSYVYKIKTIKNGNGEELVKTGTVALVR